MGYKRGSATPMTEEQLEAALAGLAPAAQWTKLRQLCVETFGIEGGISAAAKLGKDGARQALLTGELPESFGHSEGVSIAGRLEAVLKDLVADEGKIREIVQDELAIIDSKVQEALRNVTSRTEFRINTYELGTVEHVHKALPRAFRKIVIGVPVMLIGGAGSFKSSGAIKMAELWQELRRKTEDNPDLEVPFYYESMSYQTTEVRLKGFMDANGNFQSSLFYKAYKFGGIYCLDEADAANPQVLLALNGAISAPFAYFANGEKVMRHPNFRIVATANTYALGGDTVYVGRSQLDAATLDRFAKVRWDYDELMERAVIVGKFGNNPIALRWMERCHAIRHKAEEFGMKVVIATPRAVFNGAEELCTITPTPPIEDVEDDYLWTAVSKADARKIREAL